MNSSPAMTPSQRRFTEQKEGALTLYKEIAVGKRGWGALAWYELLTMLLSGLSGLAGLGLRALCYPTILGSCGKKVAFGKGMVLRQPQNILIGKNVIFDDYVVLDVRGAKGKIIIEDHVTIGRFTTITAKDGEVLIRKGANIGSYCRIATQSRVEIGESVLVAAYCYVGPGNHQRPAAIVSGDVQSNLSLDEGYDPAQEPDLARDPAQLFQQAEKTVNQQQNATGSLIEAEMEIKGGVKISEHCWIGTRSTVLDGCELGRQAIVGAHSLVRDNVGDGITVVGVPAKVLSSSKGSRED